MSATDEQNTGPGSENWQRETVGEEKLLPIIQDASQVYSPTRESDTTVVMGETGADREACYCTHVPETCHWYCESCKRAVCDGCASSVHVNHGCKQLSEMAEAIRNEAKEAVGNAQQTTTAVADIVALIQDVEASKRDACVSVQKAFDELHRAMEERRLELLAQVKEMSDTKMAVLTSRENELETLHHEMAEYCDVASHTLDTLQEEEVTPLWDLLATEVQAVRNRFEAMPPVSLGVTTAYVDTTRIAEAISKFGVIDHNF